MQLFVLPLGKMLMDKNYLIDHALVADRNHRDRANEYIEIPLAAYLIRHPQGNILFDTGCHPKACLGPDGHWPLHAQDRSPCVCGPEDNLLYRLEQIGLKPDQIDWVVMSHLHLDHAGGIDLFPQARILVHLNEFNACLRAYAMQDPAGMYIWQDTDGWIRRGFNWNPVADGDGDLPLLPGVTVLNLGSGHAQGMLGLHIQLPKTGGILLVSDAIYSSQNFGPPVRMQGVAHDTVGWRSTIERVRRYAQETGAQIWFGHDLEQFAGLTKSYQGLYE